MKIYTKIVIDVSSGDMLEEISYEYTGDVVEAKGGKVKAPQPSAQEVALQQKQLDILERQEREQELLQPFIYEELGLKRISKEGAFTDEQRDRFSFLEDEIGRLEDVTVQGAPTKGQYSTQEEYSEARAADLQRKNEARDLLGDYRREHSRLEDIGGGFTLEKIPEEPDELEELYKERQLAALKGELPVSPALEAEIGTQETQTREDLARRLGPQFSQTTSGIQSMSEFQKRAGLLREEARRGQIGLGEGLLSSRMGLLSDVQQRNIANLQGTGAPQQRLLSQFPGALQPFQQQRALGFQAAQQTAANKSAAQAGKMQVAGSVVGTVVTVAAIL